MKGWTVDLVTLGGMFVACCAAILLLWWVDVLVVQAHAQDQQWRRLLACPVLAAADSQCKPISRALPQTVCEAMERRLLAAPNPSILRCVPAQEDM